MSSIPYFDGIPGEYLRNHDLSWYSLGPTAKTYLARQVIEGHSTASELSARFNINRKSINGWVRKVRAGKGYILTAGRLFSMMQVYHATSLRPPPFIKDKEWPNLFGNSLQLSTSHPASELSNQSFILFQGNQPNALVRPPLQGYKRSQILVICLLRQLCWMLSREDYHTVMSSILMLLRTTAGVEARIMTRFT